MGVITSILGGFVSAAGDKQAAAAKQQQLNANAAEQNYQAQIAINNQSVATSNARLQMASGEEQTFAAGLKNRQNIGAIKAGQAASGIDVNSGSAVDVRSSADELGQLDALTVRSNAAREAYGYKVQASNFGAEAESDKFAASNDIIAGKEAKEAGDIAAVGSILGGINAAVGSASAQKGAGMAVF